MPAGGRGGRGNTREFLGLGAAPDAAAAARGEKLYAPNCAFCHGDKARGASGPNLVRCTVVLRDEKGETLGPFIAKGLPDKGMPAFPNFAEGQLSDIAQFLHLQVELVANRGLYKRLNIVTGDAKAGEAYFNGAGGCNQCHSPTGDLKGIASRFDPMALQQRWLGPRGGGGRGGRGGGGAAGPSPLDQYRRGFGDEGIAAIKQFVEAGGTLVTFGEAGSFAIERFDLPIRDVTAGLPFKQFWCPGCTLKITVDTANKLGYGMPHEAPATWLAGSQAYEIQSNAPAGTQVIARFVDKDVLQSGWLLGESVIAGKPTMVSVPVGQGRVVLIGFRVQHRDQTHGTYKLLFNALQR